MLKPARTISPQDWMRESDILSVVDCLNKGDAQEPKVLFVGVCVRNALLGHAVDDIDMASKYKPDEVTKLLSRDGFKVVPTGIDHGTVTVVTSERHIEITTLRRDVETDGRRAVIAFTDQWEEDAQRRDFTMNTLLADHNGRIYDPTGEGLKDLDAGKVRFVGDPVTRIKEDVLRILRYFRFHGFYGAGVPDPEILGMFRDHTDLLKTLSAERVTQEFFKILTHDEPQEILEAIFKAGLYPELKVSGTALKTLGEICALQKRYGLRAVPPRLYQMAGRDRKKLEGFSKTLLIPKLYMKDIAALDEALNIEGIHTGKGVKVALYKTGRNATAQALLFALADDHVMHGFMAEALDLVQNWDIPTFPLNGQDLIEQGYEPGPELGRRLEALEQEWIENGFDDKFVM